MTTATFCHIRRLSWRCVTARVIPALFTAIAPLLASNAAACADAEDDRPAVGACNFLRRGFTVSQAVQEVEENLAADGYPLSQEREPSGSSTAR